MKSFKQYVTEGKVVPRYYRILIDVYIANVIFTFIEERGTLNKKLEEYQRYNKTHSEFQYTITQLGPSVYLLYDNQLVFDFIANDITTLTLATYHTIETNPLFTYSKNIIEKGLLNSLKDPKNFRCARDRRPAFVKTIRGGFENAFKNLNKTGMQSLGYTETDDLDAL